MVDNRLQEEVDELREQVETLTRALMRLAKATKDISDVTRQLPAQPFDAPFKFMEIDSIVREIETSR